MITPIAPRQRETCRAPASGGSVRRLWLRRSIRAPQRSSWGVMRASRFFDKRPDRRHREQPGMSHVFAVC